MATVSYDVVCYGGYYGEGWFSCVAAAREGLKCAFVTEDKQIGGMMAFSLGVSDIGKTGGLGGSYERYFVQKTGEWYGLNKSYRFAPSVAETIAIQLLNQHGVAIYSGSPIVAINKTGTNLNSITLLNNLILQATYFVEGSVELDLLQRVGTEGQDWIVGRESSAVYGESAAGFNQHPIVVNINPTGADGNRLPHIRDATNQTVGSADGATQNATVRVVVSDAQLRKSAWRASATYDPAEFVFEKTRVNFTTGRYMPGGIEPGKFQDNDNTIVLNTDASWGPVGVPVHWLWPKATPTIRRLIEKKISDYVYNKRYFFANDPSVAGPYQDTIKNYGLPLDEFPRNGNRTYVYMRESARAITEYVCAQDDTTNTNPLAARNIYKNDAVVNVVYSLDIHYTQLMVNPANPNTILMEGEGGGFQVAPCGWSLPYRSLLPKRTTCTNLLVCYGVGVSHVAWGSFRILHQPFSASEVCGIAIAQAKRTGVALHDIDIPTLRKSCRDTYGMVIDPFWDGGIAISIGAKTQYKGKTYICTQAGITGSTGPAGSGTGIVDGTVIWDYFPN